MKYLFLTLNFLISNLSYSQDKFTNCSAAFLNGKMIVENYDDTTKAKIAITAKGELTAATAELGENYAKIVDKFSFGVAIKDKNTGTIMLYSNKTYMKFNIEDALKLCKKGDWLVILTTKDEYALPHNEILVE
jgi:hypothetical protein